MATHSSILPWRIPWIIRKKSNITERLSLSFTFCPNLEFVNTSLSCHLALCCVLLVECRRDIAKYSRGSTFLLHSSWSFLLLWLAICGVWMIPCSGITVRQVLPTEFPGEQAACLPTVCRRLSGTHLHIGFARS